MKKFFSIFLGVLFFFIFSFSAFAERLKIGYVDTIEVFNEYQRTKDQEEELDKKKEEVKEALEAKERKIRETQRRLEVLREDQQDGEREALRKEIESYRNLRQAQFADVQKKRDTMMRKIVEDIDQAISNYARENNYDFIINGNSVIYGLEESDLTSEILNIINQAYRR